MIVYYKGAFNLNLLFRIHGSAMYRATFPALLSVLVYLWVESSDSFDSYFNHPAPISVLVSSISLLFIFRANFGYGRYWEACNFVFNMQSKFLDAAIHTACYHLQCDHYMHMKPPSYYNYPDLSAKRFMTRDRYRSEQRHQQQQQQQQPDDNDNDSVESSASDATPHQANNRSWRRRQQRLRHHWSSSRSSVDNSSSQHAQSSSSSSSSLPVPVKSIEKRLSAKMSMSRIERSHQEISQDSNDSEIQHLTGKPRLDGGWKNFYKDGKSTHYLENHASPRGGFASTQGGATPQLFLQELAHLTSLLSAVALATLRNDVDGAESPLTSYTPGSEWPNVDPTNIIQTHHSFRQVMDYVLKWLGMDRTPQARTRFNSLRPLQVLGGVSMGEAAFLQAAHGPAAKTQLAFVWCSSLIESEHLAGGMGNVESAIMSRTMQFLGDGMNAYQQARKIMYIPFPFAHAQLSVFAQFVLTLAVPLVLVQYTNETWLGAVLSFGTVLMLCGLHEVAKELENPFRNVPNDIPVCTLQAMFNESLITMYAGYHPDAYFTVKELSCSKKELRQSLYKRYSGSVRLQREDEEDLPAEEPPRPEEDKVRRLQLLIQQQSERLKETNREIEELIQQLSPREANVGIQKKCEHSLTA